MNNNTDQKDSDHELLNGKSMDFPPYVEIYFTPIYYASAHRFVLCIHKHKSFEEVITCLHKLGNDDPKVTVHEVREKELPMVVGVSHFTINGANCTYNCSSTFSDYRTNFRDGSGLTLKKIRELVRKEKAQKKAASK